MIETLDIVQLEAKRLAWSKSTFTEATAYSSIKKLIVEAKEIQQDIQKGKREPEEYADALMCLFDSAGRQDNPISAQEIFEAFAIKLEKNINRQWVKNPDNTYSHVKPINSLNTEKP